MTPNDIILALVDVASAAFAAQHSASPCAVGLEGVSKDDLARLRAKLFVLDRLPQPANMPPLTPSAKARYFMQSFLEGAPIQIDGKEFSAALILSGLGEQVPQPTIQAVAQTPTNANDGWVLAKETVVEMPNGQKELGYTVIHGFPVFTDEQDAHKSHGDLELPLGWVVMRVGQLIPGYVLPEITRADMDALRDKLLADTATEAHRIYNDADLLDQLRRVCGYIENGGGQYVTIGQDDATREWTLSAGLGQNKRRYTAGSFHQAIRLAAEGEVDRETCKFCGFDVEFPCDAPPPDICSAAIRADQRDRHLKPPVVVKADVTPMQAGVAAVKQSLKELAREAMKKTLIELKDMTDATTAKRIIAKVGGALKMMDIPDDKVNAVTIAARDRMALERRLAELRAAGDQVGVESLLRGLEEKPATFAPSAPAPSFPAPPPYKRPEDYVPGEETFAPPALLITPPLPASEEGVTWIQGTTETRPDDAVQGQGGTFDGAGASGDFQ